MGTYERYWKLLAPVCEARDTLSKYSFLVYPHTNSLYKLASGEPIDWRTHVFKPEEINSGLVDDLYSAISDAEFRNKPEGFNRWVRADKPRRGSSSSYGEVQINRERSDDYTTRLRRIFSPEQLAYGQGLTGQGTIFLYHGAMEGKIPDYNALYDYGGRGHMADTEEQQQMYRSFAKRMMLHDITDVAKGDVNRFARGWRGLGISDPAYFDVFYDRFAKLRATRAQQEEAQRLAQIRAAQQAPVVSGKPAGSFGIKDYLRKFRDFIIPGRKG